MSTRFKNSRYPLFKIFNFRSFSVFHFRFTSKLFTLGVLEHLPFYPKYQNLTSLRRHFLRNFPADFSQILMEDVKLVLDMALNCSRRYLPLFLSYREYTGMGTEYAHPTPDGWANGDMLIMEKVRHMKRLAKPSG